MSIWLVHIKEHVWTMVGTCPTTILLSAVTMCECVCEWQQWRRLYQEDLCAAWGMWPVCSPGSWSGRGWLPLILAWHGQSDWPWLHIIVKWSQKPSNKLIDCYIKTLQITDYRINKIYNRLPKVGKGPLSKNLMSFWYFQFLPHLVQYVWYCHFDLISIFPICGNITLPN